MVNDNKSQMRHPYGGKFKWVEYMYVGETGVIVAPFFIFLLIIITN